MTIQGKICLVTAGPTYEAIDPVRFIGNRSSGKMGLEIAHELAKNGGIVTLVIGPNHLKIDQTIFHKLIQVESSDEMYNAVMVEVEKMEIGVFSAAVADYKPKEISSTKIKKSDDHLTIELVKTKDILKEVGLNKRADQFVLGFALETNNELENAQSKLERKNLDMIVLNSLQDAGAGFQHDTNKVTVIDRQNNMTEFELKSKTEVAKDIVHLIANY